MQFSATPEAAKMGLGVKGFLGLGFWGSGGPEQYSWSAITTDKQAILGHIALPQEVPQRSLCFFPIFFCRMLPRNSWPLTH